MYLCSYCLHLYWMLILVYTFNQLSHYFSFRAMFRHNYNWVKVCAIMTQKLGHEKNLAMFLMLVHLVQDINSLYAHKAFTIFENINNSWPFYSRANLCIPERSTGWSVQASSLQSWWISHICDRGPAFANRVMYYQVHNRRI